MAKATGFDPQAPLDRVGGESLRANRAFRDYVMMGPTRSIRKLLEQYRAQKGSKEGALSGQVRQPGPPPEDPPTIRQTSLMTWSRELLWQDRLEAWERLRAADREAIWLARMEEHKESEWNLKERLEDLAIAVLDAAPNFIKSKRRVIKETGEILVTAALDADVALKAAEIASKLGRLATGAETDRQRVEHTGSLGINAAPEFVKLDDEQLNQIIDNLLAAGAERTVDRGADGEAPPDEPPGGDNDTSDPDDPAPAPDPA